MQRLGNRAFEILTGEINGGSQDNLTSELGRKIVLQRLDKLRLQMGEPLSYDELRQIVSDQFPDFDEKVLQEAASVNRTPQIYQQVMRGSLIVVGLMAFIWFVNLPVPFIRWPVSKTIPVLLFPSYMNMNYHYKQAIADAEYTEKLIQEATTNAEIDLSEQEIRKAYQHLERVPGWFLDFNPKFYCSLFKCSWQFTTEEYEETRDYIQKIEGKIIQEQYAQERFNEAESALNSARKEYQNLKSGERQVIAAWQTAIDLFDQIPSDTLAGRLSENRSLTAQQDFEKQVDQATREKRGTTLIATAQQYAVQAVNVVQDPPHPVEKWEQAVNLWEQAIRQLEKISKNHSSYQEAQEKLSEYNSNLKKIKQRLQDEKDSIEAMKKAQELIAEWRELTRSDDLDYRVMNRQLANIIYTLEDVQPGTTVNAEAQDLLRRTRYTRSQL
jgi:tetratricopeptide (TPR) repeat protein